MRVLSVLVLVAGASALSLRVPRRAIAGGAAAIAAAASDVARAYDRAAYDAYAPTYDALDGGRAAALLGIDGARAALVARARGRVLEVGAGTLLNARYYAANAAVDAVVAVDASPGMVAEARRRAAATPGFVGDVRVGDAARLPFADASFDACVDTFSLCVYDDPSAVLRELRRVVRRDGVLLLLENARPANPLLAAYTDATADFVAAHGGRGCRYNQDVAALARASAFAVEAEMPLAGGAFRSLVLRPRA